jgi:hypothetical protein
MNLADEIAPPETGLLTDNSGEELLHDCCRELGVNMAMAMQIVAWADERFGHRRNGNFPLEDLRALDSKQRQAWHILVSYQAGQKTLRDAQMSTRVMALELGYTTAAGADNVSDLARITGFSKQTLNKCDQIFQTKLGLPARPGQRNLTARKNMSLGRKRQLAEPIMLSHLHD